MQSLFMFFGEALCFLAFKIFYYYYDQRNVSIYGFCSLKNKLLY